MGAIDPGAYPDDVALVRERCFPRWYREGSPPGGLLYRAIGDGGLCGYLIVHVAGKVAYVEELAVDPGWRGGGVARSLVVRAAADLAWRVERMTVFPMSGSMSGSRRAVFLALGFHQHPEHDNLLFASPAELCGRHSHGGERQPDELEHCVGEPENAVGDERSCHVRE